MSLRDLDYAKTELIDKRKDAEIYRKYYEGDQPMIYSYSRLREIFGSSRMVTYVQNWCSVVINAALDRLIFRGWNSEETAIDGTLQEFYTMQDLRTLSREVHEDALVTGEGFVVFDKPGGQVRAFRNDPLNVQAIYEDGDPETLRYVMKVWQEDFWGENQRQKAVRANLYYSDRIEKYVASGGWGSNNAGSVLPTSFTLMEDPGPNPFAPNIPVVHFEPAVLELQDVVTLQDAINKLFTDMMVTGEFNAFRQRYLISNANLEKLKSNPQSLWQIPKGTSDEESTQVGEFSASDLSMFLTAMEKLANSIAIISRTPKYYMMATGSNVSGEALTVMESPLVKKCEQHQALFSKRWNDVAEFVVGEAPNISPSWDEIETAQTQYQIQAMKDMVSMGIPLKTVLKQFGWTKDELDQLDKDMEEQRNKEADMASNAYSIARQNIERQNLP